MKRAISCTCLAAAFAVGLSAQTPAPSTSTSQAATDAKTVTATGCLRAGDAPGSFVLSNAKVGDKAKASGGAAGAMTPSAPMGATGTAGTAGSTAASPAGKDMDSATIKLTGSPAGVTLSDHVGHTVQVTGTAAPSAAGTSGMTSPQSEPGAAAASNTKAPAAITLTAFSMVSGSCSM